MPANLKMMTATTMAPMSPMMPSPMVHLHLDSLQEPGPRLVGLVSGGRRMQECRHGFAVPCIPVIEDEGLVIVTYTPWAAPRPQVTWPAECSRLEFLAL